MASLREQGTAEMLADIRANVAFTKDMIGKDALDPRIMAAMARVPRDKFVPDGLKEAAFADGPLPIGHGQTISQPYIVALMSDLLGTEPDHVVLEVGTGSGYQTAVLSLLCATVYSMDLIAALTEEAAERLAQLGFSNVHVRNGNGYEGWPEHGPYDGIIVTAAATHIPGALVDQLKPGGRLVIPVGQPHMRQELLLLSKDMQGHTDVRDILAVAFVPMIDRHGIL
jgi:protein-L-isoaspartate(D-aspartate) O-methyltransferase